MYKDLEKWLKNNFPTKDLYHSLKILEKDGYLKRKIKRTSKDRPQSIIALLIYEVSFPIKPAASAANVSDTNNN